MSLMTYRASTRFYVEELGDALRTTIKESADSATAGEKLRVLAVAELLSFLLRILPHEPPNALIESVGKCLSIVVESALSTGGQDSYFSRICLLLLKRLSSVGKGKYRTVIHDIKKRAMDCVGQGSGNRGSASEILSTIGSVTTDWEILRDCVKSLSSIVGGQADDACNIGIIPLQNLVTLCVLGASKAVEVILQADGELEAMVDSALSASDTATLSASSRAYKDYHWRMCC